MKTLFLLVLAVAGLTFSSAFAGEVLVNKETGQIRVEETNLWRSANAFEMEAYQNPGTEVPVWSSNHLEKVNFFHSQWVKTATNVVVYRDEKIQSLAKKATEKDDILFLWYKLWLIVAMMLMVVSNIAFLHHRKAKASFALLATIFAITAMGFYTMSFPGGRLLFSGLGFFILCTCISAEITAIYTAFGDDSWHHRICWLFSGILYIMATVALIV